MVKKLLFTLLAMHYALCTLATAASVEATVNTQEVVKGNPIKLRIKAIGGSAAFPNISNINGISVTGLGTSRQSSMSITPSGMKKETSTVKKYTFVPQEDMTIPSYTINISGKKYKTNPIKIKVVESKAPAVQENGKFSFVLKSDKKSVSVGESFIMTVYMSISDRLKGIQISEYIAPSSPDFFIKEIAGQKEYAHNGYTVIEKKYIVTTKKAGHFSISSAIAKLGQPDWSMQDIFGRPSITWIPIKSNALEIEVKALQTDADLVGEFTLTQQIDAQSVQANKPVNLSIKIEGKGNLEDFVFPKYEINGVTVYSDDAKVESHIENEELVSTYSKSFAFISDSNFVIPARSISVYNPQTKETKKLEIQSYDISIEGAKIPVQSTADTVEHINQTEEPKVIEKKVEVKSVAWWMLVLAFVLGMLFLYLLQRIPNMLAKGEKSYKESDALKVLYAHISEGKEVEEMVRKLYAKKSGDKSVKIDKKELRAMVERFR